MNSSFLFSITTDNLFWLWALKLSLLDRWYVFCPFSNGGHHQLTQTNLVQYNLIQTVTLYWNTAHWTGLTIQAIGHVKNGLYKEFSNGAQWPKPLFLLIYSLSVVKTSYYGNTMGWNANLFMTLKEKFYPKNWENYPFKSLAPLLSVTALPLVHLSKSYTSVWAVIKTEVYKQCKSIEFQFSVKQLQWMSKSVQLNWNWKPLLVILIRLPLRDWNKKVW